MTDTQQRRQPQQTRADVATNGGGGPAAKAVQNMHERQARIADLAQIVKSSAGLFSRLLPSHIGVETFMGAAGAALWKDANLMLGAITDPEAFLIALREAASLGHIAGTDAYWLTPRKRGQSLSVLGIEGYQGIIQRMYQGGGVLSVRSRVVRQLDTFEPDGGPMGTPVHRFGGPGGAFSTREDRGPVVGAYAYAILVGGYASQAVLMSMEDLMEHRASATTKNVWDTWPEAMYRKTVLRGLEPYVPTSAEYRESAARAVASIAAVAPTQPRVGAGELEQAAVPTEGDTPVNTPAAPSAPVTDRAGSPGPTGAPVTDVAYDPKQWGGDDPAWADLQVARPGEGVPPGVTND